MCHSVVFSNTYGYGKRCIMPVSMTDRLKQSRRETYASPGVGLALRGVWVDALTQLHQY